MKKTLQTNPSILAGNIDLIARLDGGEGVDSTHYSLTQQQEAMIEIRPNQLLTN